MKNRSLLNRFYRYKYSGPIVFVPLILLIVIPVGIMYSEKEFFDVWNCETLEKYPTDKSVPDKFPSYNELTERQHEKLQTLLDECRTTK